MCGASEACLTNYLVPWNPAIVVAFSVYLSPIPSSVARGSRVGLNYLEVIPPVGGVDAHQPPCP